MDGQGFLWYTNPTSLYIHYTAIFDLNSAKKISLKQTQIFLKNKILKSGEVLPFLDILQRL